MSGSSAPAQLDGAPFGYTHTAAHATRLLAGAERLGIDDTSLAAVAHADRDGSCASVRDRLTEVAAARRTVMESRLAEQLGLSRKNMAVDHPMWMIDC
ncbi:hypothetical protein [Dactylosporangium sp. CA-233914]|uniref:hypothetical protein n=1 Tax=Dactylosporangium sp. CA-233914 TaxID=3239934 RepID=UPI003D91ADD5